MCLEKPLKYSPNIDNVVLYFAVMIVRVIKTILKLQGRKTLLSQAKTQEKRMTTYASSVHVMWI